MSKQERRIRIWKAFLTLMAAFLIFAGPTYIVFLLTYEMGVSYAYSVTFGVILLILGLMIVFWLVKTGGIE